MTFIRWTILTILCGAFIGVLSMGCESNFNSSGSTDGDSDADADHVLVGISIEPMNWILEVDLDAPTTMPYKCIGYFEDLVNEDLTAEVTWSSSNPNLGSFSGPDLEIPAISEAGAEVTMINANYNDQFESDAQLTVVAYRKTGPSQDFFFSLPYQDPGGEQEKPLDFSTEVPALDVFFDMDTTGSMFSTINSLQSSLTGTIIPNIQASIPDTWFGVGAYEDFPISPYGHDSCMSSGGEPDQPFELFQEMTDNVSLALAGVNALSIGTSPIGCGADGAESMVESLYQIATGQGLTTPGPTDVPANTSGVGGVGFREFSMPAIVPLTDVFSHNGVDPSENYAGSVSPVAHTSNQTVDALNDICARVVGVATSTPFLPTIAMGDPDMIAMAEATGAVVPPVAWGDAASRPPGCAVGQCCTSFNGEGRAPNASGMCPLAYMHSGGTSLGDTVVTGLEMLTHYAAFDCVTETSGEDTDMDGVPLPTGYTTADFIKSIVPNSYVVPSDPPGLPVPVMTADGFDNVTPGTVVTFDVAAFNDFVEQTSEAQFFEASITVLAGGCFPLDDRVVLILVPPMDIEIQ